MALEKCLLHFVRQSLDVKPCLHCVLQGVVFRLLGGCGWNGYNNRHVGSWSTIVIYLRRLVWWLLVPEDAIGVNFNVLEEASAFVCRGSFVWR